MFEQWLMDIDNMQDKLRSQPNADSRCRRGLLTALVATMILLVPVPAEAQRQTYDARDVALLPSYCKHTLLFRKIVPGGDNEAEIKRWSTAMGNMFQHMHHYCWGLIDTNRAMLSASSRQERMRSLKEANRNFNYVIRHASPDFVVLPEILTRKGENLILLGRGPQGVAELRRAIELKPDYWPPYAHLSDYYKKAGEIAKAQEWVEKGLSSAPDTKALQRRLAELDALKAKRKTTPPSTGEPEAPALPVESKRRIRQRIAADPAG